MRKSFLILLIVGIIFCITSCAWADVDLEQCGINNHNAICSQTIEKIEDQKREVVIIKEKKEELTMSEFIGELVAIVKERKAENNLIINTYMEDNNSSVLVGVNETLSNKIICVNGLCANENEWR